VVTVVLPIDAPPQPDSPVEALDRGLRVVEALAQAGPEGLPLTGLAALLGVNKSTVYRALTALRLRDFVLQDQVTGVYRLGPRPLHLADVYLSQENLPHLLAPALRSLSAEVDELVHLGVLNLPRVTYIAKVEPARAIRVWSTVGGRSPAATSALGRSLLACLDPVGEESLTVPGRSVDLTRTMAAVDRARGLGFADEHEENEPGVTCVAMPLMRGDSPVAAVSVTAPAQRMSATRVREVARVMREVLNRELPSGIAVRPER
jgi:DNA-binding IclR family transcriptional regulator